MDSTLVWQQGINAEDQFKPCFFFFFELHNVHMMYHMQLDYLYQLWCKALPLFPHMLPIEFHFEARLKFLILAYNQYPLITTIQITGGHLNYLKWKSVWFKLG